MVPAEQREVRAGTSPASTSEEAAIAAYSTDPYVQARLLEHCGATPTQPPSAAYLAVLHGDEQPHVLWQHARRLSPLDVATALRIGDVSRALADARHLVLLLDLDYLNVDVPSEPFTHPAEAFFKMEPVYRAVRRVFAAYDLPALASMTGRGYHFAGVIPLEEPLVDTLAGLLAHAPPWFRDRTRQAAVAMDERVARASAGLGLLIEFLVHRILALASAHTQVPVVVNGTPVGVGRVGRECISIDCSHLGDPLDVRSMRLAFGTYRWHQFRPDIFGSAVAALPTLAVLPRDRQSLASMLAQGRGLPAARRAARRRRAMLPVQTEALEHVLDDYRQSRLAAFHRDYYGSREAGPARPLAVSSLPPCVAAALRTPNDLLLRPEYLQHLTRGLIALGWHPRQIAELVCATYEADHRWGDIWLTLHPRSRAEFDVRVFAGLIATGVDRLVDFNCVSAQEKGLCPAPGCRGDLRVERAVVLERQKRGEL